MIPFIRSLSELMVITESRDSKGDVSQKNDIYCSTVDIGQRKRDTRSIEKNKVELPDLPKSIRYKWIDNKKSVSKFFNDLDYNNQIQSSYDLTLLGRAEKRSQQDVA